jgi:hypothetical protein
LFRNEQLLKQGLEINDRLQNVLSKYDAIAAGTHLAVEGPARETVESPREEPIAKPSPPHIVEKDIPNEEEDEFAQLAQRYCLQYATCIFLHIYLRFVFYSSAEKINP